MTETKKKVSLASLLTPSKTVTVDYPEFEGFSVQLCYLSREELVKLRARCLSQKFNRKTKLIITLSISYQFQTFTQQIDTEFYCGSRGMV